MPPKKTWKSTRNIEMCQALRSSLAELNEMEGNTEHMLHDTLTNAGGSSHKFISRWRLRTRRSCGKLRKTLSESIIAAFINEDIITVRSANMCLDLRMIRVPSLETDRGLIFRIIKRTGAASVVPKDQIVYADADDGGKEATLNIPRVGTVSIAVPESDYSAPVSVTCDM